MKKATQSYNILLLILLSFFSFFINYYYGNIGTFPIDTFAFFDTSYNILIDRHPFRDIWITTGFLVDYILTSRKIQAIRNDNISYHINPNPLAPSLTFVYNFD